MNRQDGASTSRQRTRALADRWAPPGTERRRLVRVGYQLARDGRRYTGHLRASWTAASRRSGGEPEYRAWLDEHRSTASELITEIRRSTDSGIRVAIEFVVVDNGGQPGAELRQALRAQTYPNWSVISAEDDPTAPEVTSHGIERGQVAARLREGDPSAFIVFLAADDVVEPDLAFQIAANAHDDPFIDLMYWDDDILGVDKLLTDPRFRPEWSPDTLLSTNYIGRSFAIRRRRLVAAGGLTGTDAASWWELLLRAGFCPEHVHRIPRLLSHLVRRPNTDVHAGAELVTRHLERNAWDAHAEPDHDAVRVRWDIPSPPPVTVIIPTRHNREMLDRCLPSLVATSYPRFAVVIVDNGGRSAERDDWYEKWKQQLDLTVLWWEEPFNYSAVNNAAANIATGDVLVFLNDDTEAADPDWLVELVGWATRPEIGTVGLQLTGADGCIQHGGVVLGMHGFADHLFAGMKPGEDTLLGPTRSYRNLLAVTAACVAVRRSVFEAVGGFDERFVLCGSDVVLGLDVRRLGLRTICSPFTPVRHLESVTRGTDIPAGDFFASYWRYQRWLRAGDPYFSPNLSLQSSQPKLRRAHEPSPLQTVADSLGRDFTVFRQQADEAESYWLADTCRADEALEDSGRTRPAHSHSDVRTVTWFVPDIDSPFYGGINTALRLADYLARRHGVENRFVVMSAPNALFFRSALEAAFPALGRADLAFVDGPNSATIANLPPSDVAIATLWVTAYSVARFRAARQAFYLIQDFEPMFYPAGTNYALAEESYRLGLYGLCNTERLRDLYENDYGGSATAFMPAVDRTVFHDRDREPLEHDGPITVFVYARPGHWRNCWEIASLALAQVKDALGDQVRIVTAGSWARPDDLGAGIRHLGLLDYADTGNLYRRCDVGVALTVSAHPSYLPLELMACGVPVIAFDNPAGDWILRSEENCLRTPLTVDGLAQSLERLASDGQLRTRLAAQGVADIAANHHDWDDAFEGVYEYLCDPESAKASGPHGR